MEVLTGRGRGGAARGQGESIFTTADVDPRAGCFGDLEAEAVEPGSRADGLAWSRR